MDDLPFSAACERNREPILAVLRKHFAACRKVFEIGGGSGQHAEYFAAALPWLTWQSSERAANLAGLRARLDRSAPANAPAPIPFDVNDAVWPANGYDALFTANTLHIMSWPEVERLFARLDTLLAKTATVVVYGPFNYAGRFTSASNATFDAALKARAPHMGIRDFEAVDQLAHGAGLRLVEDIAMPANNRCLVWSRGAGHPPQADPARPRTQGGN